MENKLISMIFDLLDSKNLYNYDNDDELKNVEIETYYNLLQEKCIRTLKEISEKYMNEPDDMMLIQAYIAGDGKAFETLYYRYRQPLYGYLNNLTGKSCEADEVFSETWQKVIKKLPKYSQNFGTNELAITT